MVVGHGLPTWNIGVSALIDSSPSSSMAGVMPTVDKNDNPNKIITAPTPYHKYLVCIISLAIDFHEFLSLLVEVFVVYFDPIFFSYPCRHERLLSKACYSMDIVP